MKPQVAESKLLPVKIDEAASNLMRRLATLDECLNEITEHHTREALVWLKDVNALLSIRKNVEDIRKKALVIEAKILRRISSLYDPEHLEQIGLSQKDQRLAIKIQSWSQEEFKEFLDHLDGQTLYSNVYAFQRNVDIANIESDEEELTKWSKMTEQERENHFKEHERLAQKLQKSETALTLRHVISREIEKTLSNEDSFEVRDVVSKLAQTLDLEDDASMCGLGHLVREAVNESISEDSSMDHGGFAKRLADLGLQAPRAVCYYDFGWRRVPFYDSTIAELEYMVRHRKNKAQEACLASERLESLLDFLKKNETESGSDLPPKCCDILIHVFGKHGTKGLKKVPSRPEKTWKRRKNARLKDEAVNG